MTRMGSEEDWRECKQCGTKLKKSDKVCPKCGSTNVKNAHSRKAFVAIGLDIPEAKAEHEAHWSSKSYTILAGILAIILSLLSVAVCELLPLAPWLKIAILFIVLLTLALIIYWQRYHVLMFTRWLDRKFTASKRYGDKKRKSR